MTDADWRAVETRLRAYVRRRVDGASVDDVVADTMLKLVRHADRWQSTAQPLAWMHRIAARSIVDLHRQRSARARLRAAVAAEDRTAAAAGDGREAAADLACCLLRFVRALPKPYGEALELTAFHGLTQAAAAARLGLSHSGMKSRVQRGRAELKRALLRCCRVEVDRRGNVIDYAQRPACCAEG